MAKFFKHGQDLKNVASYPLMELLAQWLALRVASPIPTQKKYLYDLLIISVLGMCVCYSRPLWPTSNTLVVYFTWHRIERNSLSWRNGTCSYGEAHKEEERIETVKELTNLANKSIFLITVGDFHIRESEWSALGNIVDMVDPHSIAVLEPLVLSVDELVQRLVVACYVRHWCVVRLKKEGVKKKLFSIKKQRDLWCFLLE